jgi:hypothetical protein
MDKSRAIQNSHGSSSHSRSTTVGELFRRERETAQTRQFEWLLASEPEIRTDRVEAVRRKLEAGEYPSREVIDAIALVLADSWSGLAE